MQRSDEDRELTKSIKIKIMDYMNTRYDKAATQERLDMDPRLKASYIRSEKVSDIKTGVMSEH